MPTPGAPPISPHNLPLPPAFQIKSQQSEVTRILDGKNIKYELVDISQDNALREEMRAKAGNPKAIPPQIVNGDQYCGVRALRALPRVGTPGLGGGWCPPGLGFAADVQDVSCTSCRLFIVRCRDQVLPGFTAWEKGTRQGGALGGSGAVPTLPCHPWHSQLVPGLRDPPVAFPCRITSSSWRQWSKTLCRSS